MTTTALIPLRALNDGKRRLAMVLTAAERSLLVRRLFERTLDALQSSRVIDLVAVVSPDPALLFWVSQFNVLPILQPHQGLNAGLEHGRQALLVEHDVRSLLVVLPDLPYVAPDDIRAAVYARAPQTVALVADRHGQGTNALLLNPPTAIPFRFGLRSLVRHREAALAHGLRVEQVQIPGLAFDLDTPDDLHEASGVMEELAGVRRM